MVMVMACDGAGSGDKAVAAPQHVHDGQTLGATCASQAGAFLAVAAIIVFAVAAHQSLRERVDGVRAHAACREAMQVAVNLGWRGWWGDLRGNRWGNVWRNQWGKRDVWFTRAYA
jgi:hypothetical protein